MPQSLPFSNSSTNLALKRLQLIVAYDGTDFCGWAPQKDQRTVQSTLTDIVRQVSGEDCEIIGASRTDSGAHADFQVCHFDTDWKAESVQIPRILNNLLPADVAVQCARFVPESFHSRFSAIDRTYRYRIRQNPRFPSVSRFTHDYWRKLDLEAMQQAASSLVGSHDFRAFSEEVEMNANAIREIFEIKVRETGREIWIDIRGNAFMRGMMRRISGGLFEVGRGKRTISDIADLLDLDKRQTIQWPVVLPAKGLCLKKIRYGKHPKDFRSRYQQTDLKGEIPDLENK